MSSANTHFLLVCVSILISVSYAPQATAQPFEGCRVSGESATIVIPSDVNVQFGMNGQRSLDTNDLIAAYTDDDQCAGVSNPWDGSQTTLPVFSEDQLPGYTNGESITLRIYDASEDEQFEFASAKGELTFTDCSELPEIGELCRDNGAYAVLSVYQVESLIDSEDVPLPVDLTAFDADVDDSTVVLRWATASETQNVGFDIQHRSPTTSRWKTLGFVEGQGTTQQPSRYQYAVRSLEPGTHRFRLLQRDVDNTTTLSPVKTARVRLTTQFRVMPPSPHPIRDRSQMTLYVQETQTIRVELYNLLGQRVQTLAQARVAADQAISIPLSINGRSAGRYLVRVTGETFQHTTPVTFIR